MNLAHSRARAAVIAERRTGERGQGPPPSPYAFAVLGSAGRGESLLAMTRTTPSFFPRVIRTGPDCSFEALSVHIADILHEVGVPYCPGGVMAKNPRWRGSLATWRARVAHWISRSNPQDLLSVDIFFDLRGVHGDSKPRRNIVARSVRGRPQGSRLREAPRRYRRLGRTCDRDVRAPFGPNRGGLT